MKKQFFISLICVIAILCTMLTASAAYLGDVSGDDKVTAADARTVLRIAAKLEQPDNENSVFADVNSDGKITAADARTVLRMAAKLEALVELTTEAPDITTKAPETTTKAPETTTKTSETTTVPSINNDGYTVINGVEVNVLPYCANGLTITDFSYTRSNDKVELTVRNDTGYAIKSTSNIAYKCYNSDGIVLKTGNVYLEDLNNGEGCNVYFYAEDDTVKIVFGDGSVRKGEASNIVEMTTIDGIQVNILPYCANGLTITAFSYTRSNDKVELTVRNDTGYAIKSTSNIEYKCYDADGIVLKTGNIYLEDMNGGESCKVYFYAEDDTVNIVFGEGSVRKQ